MGGGPVFVKLQSKVQTSVLGLGVDFVFPCHNNNNNNNHTNIYQKEENYMSGIMHKDLNLIKDNH